MLCTMYYVLCTVYCVLRTMYCLLFTMYHAPCTLYNVHTDTMYTNVQRTKYNVLCTVYCVQCGGVQPLAETDCMTISRCMFEQ